MSMANVVQQVRDKEAATASHGQLLSVTNSIGEHSRKLSQAFKMAALKVRQQSRLDLQDQMHKLKGNNLLLIEEKHEVVVDQEEENIKEDPMKSTYDSDTVFHELSDQKIADVCRFSLKLYHDTKSLQTEDESSLMMKYIREVFGHITDDTFRLMNEEAQKKSLAEKALVLKCNIIKANGLLAKDSNGKSDPYCIMTLLNKKHIDSKVVHYEDIIRWHEEGIVNKYWKTAVQPKTLDPVFNQTFELPITNPQEHYLVIELWDSDENERANPGTLRRLFRKGDKQDDFLGRVFYLLQRVPAEGEQKTLELKSHSTKHTRGTLTLHIKIIGTKAYQTDEKAHASHKQLLECIVIKESKFEDGHMCRWYFQLNQAAESLLTQHASLNQICPLQKAAIRFSVLLSYNKAHAIDMDSLVPLLRLIQQCEADMTSVPIDKPFWFDNLEKDLKELGIFILDILRRHLDIFNNFRRDENIQSLKGYLLAIHDLHQIQLYKKHLSYQQLDYSYAITNAIQVAVPHWILLLTASMTPEHNDSEHVMLAFKAFCVHCLNQCQRSYEKVHPVFMEVGVDYFSPFFATFDKLLQSEAETRIELKSRDTALLTYEIYRIIQEISGYASKVDPKYLKRHKIQLTVPQFHLWFKGCVSDWVSVAQARAKERLGRAIELDTIVKCVDRASFSSSAVDAHAFFLQVISFWKDLQWPDRGQSLGYFISVVQCLVDLATYYTTRFVEKVNKKMYTDEQGQFKVTDKLCITLNNIQHVNDILSNISTELDLPSYYKWLDEEKQEDGPPLSERAKALIKGVLDSANDDIANKIDEIIDKVKKELTPIVLNFISKMMIAPATSSAETVLEPMIKYITENVGKLGQSLLTPLFLNILKYLWVNIVAALRKEYNKVPHSSASPLHMRLNYVLLHISDFFEADGKGLDRRYIESEAYTSLRDDLFYAILPTEDIAKKFCYDLARQQVYSNKKFGILHMSHIYKPDKKVLSVDVISAENIPALDRSGKSDPFVQLFLLPSFAFPKVNEKVYKTAVKKQTLNPLFQETIKIPVNPEQLSKDGSILLLAMFDHDTIGSNDFAGLCAVACNSTPLEGSEVKVEHLNLFHFERTPAYKELEIRESDQMALDFLKQMRRFRPEGGYGQMQEDFSHSIQRLLHHKHK